jgi:hypothetical protein
MQCNKEVVAPDFGELSRAAILPVPLLPTGKIVGATAQ